jgi:hypothetical protein
MLGIVVSDSYNYTFNSLGTIFSILLLNYFSIHTIEKTFVIYVYTGSLFSILFISTQYYMHFDKNHIKIK